MGDIAHRSFLLVPGKRGKALTMGRQAVFFILQGCLLWETRAFLLPHVPPTPSRLALPSDLSTHASRCLHVPRRIFIAHSTADKATEDIEEVRLEDRDVPITHRGLHDFLYGDSEDHGATASDGSAESYDGSLLYKVSEWLQEHGESKHAAVYAIVGKDEIVKFVGVSRNIAVALSSHLANEGEDAVHSLKIRSFKYPKREKMEAMVQKWIEGCSYIPVGNVEGKEWASSSRDTRASMSPAQKEAYEEGKLKMRKALADPDLIDEMEELSSEEIELRRRLESAVDGDDWSSVIDGQTKLTEQPQPEAEKAPSANIISPFGTDGQPLAGVGPDGMASSGQNPPPLPLVSECNDLDFTPENVDKVLDEVRPYLIADGGNVRVMGIDEEARVVKLALQGACGSCPSSTTTMKMGIERVLNENFRDMGGVEQVDEASGTALADATVAVVEAILEPLRPALVAMKAKVEVLSVLDGSVKLSFSGHRKVAYGVEMALLDNPLIRRVDLEFVE